MEPLLDARQPWDRRPGETNKAYSAFIAYRDMGRRRSLRKVAALDGHPGGGTLGEWSSGHGWQDRVAAWDEHVDREAQVAQVEETIQLRTDWSKVGRAMLQKAAQGLANVDASRLTPKQVVELADCSMRFHRAALGLPDVVVGTETAEGMEERRASMWAVLQANPDALDVAESVVAKLEAMGVAPPS